MFGLLDVSLLKWFEEIFYCQEEIVSLHYTYPLCCYGNTVESLIKDTSLQGTLLLSHFDTLLC